jgi:signal transduction histidine kinase
MRALSSALTRRFISGLWLCLGLVFVHCVPAAEEDVSMPESALTNVSQLRAFASQNPDRSRFIRLEGNVWWASAAQGRMVLQDASGAEELELDFQGQAPQAGQRVRLEGNSTIAIRGPALRIGCKGPVVDNNGVHSMIEKSGAVYLEAGWQPFRVDWFNGVEKFGLEVEWQGPDFPRQRIPGEVLFRDAVNAGVTNRANGLDYRAYESPSEELPDFETSTPVNAGTVSYFDLSVASHPEHAALQFTGFLKVPRKGLYTFYVKSDDGSRLFAGEPSVSLTAIGPGQFPAPRPISIGQTLRDGEDRQWVELEGKVSFATDPTEGLRLELSAGAGRIRVEIADASGLSPRTLLNSRVRATGFCESAFTADGHRIPGILLVPDRNEVKVIGATFDGESTGHANSDVSALPLLTTAGEVHRLKREEAQRGYPVKLHGVITSIFPEHQAFTIQDSTRGLYVVDFSASRSDPPQIGEFLEVEGTTDADKFAPIVNARRVSSLGAGHLPEPVHPTWDQLLNGSLDAQYVEIQGIVTAIDADDVTLLTREGRIKLQLRMTSLKPEALARYEDALVRVRGCLLASWDYVTHQVKVGEIRINGADVAVDQPAPSDLFSIPRKAAAELLLFDPQASVFQQVKVCGQIVHIGEGEYFMMDGDTGVRFITKKTEPLEPGDLVEVAGFSELNGVSPVLREAVVRKTGHSALPEPKPLQSDNLIRADYDSTRVRVDGKLVSVREAGADRVLEMQNGLRTFAARLPDGHASVDALPIGGRLELTGVYAGQGGNRAIGQDIASFEILLNSDSDIRVLARPPWWTLERLLIMVGALACVLAVTVLWITQLHRKVEQRTIELEAQIQKRQRAEHQRAMEQERARIAQDLHDDLGSGFTEISMLAARSKSASAPDEIRNGYLEQMRGKSRDMVIALDEIVWAMNPKHDSLASLVSYFCLYADRFLGLANISWRLDGSMSPTDQVVDSRRRHQLFLAFKEALTNVVRHSGATEVRLGIQFERGEVFLSIADNGRGMASGAHTEEMDGVANMRARMENLGGRFEMTSEPGRGTALKFYVPMNSRVL